MSSIFRKALTLLSRPQFIWAALSHRVAAAGEHLPAIRLCGAATLIDVGANKGQFSLAFLSQRVDARVIAFEPLPEAADIYERVFARDDRSLLQRVAIGSRQETAAFHVADRPDSSSLLKLGDGQTRAFHVRSARQMEVEVKRLGDCVDITSLRHPIMMKVDVQGGELGVFDGCDWLEEVDFIYVELSFVELYQDQPLFNEVAEYLGNRGFHLAGVFNQLATLAFGPTQADFLFQNRARRPQAALTRP